MQERDSYSTNPFGLGADHSDKDIGHDRHSANGVRGDALWAID